ncbi:MAG: hypothetical protein LBU87_02500, partial [Lactobacillales bacterium]|nr:hypothetical protein [Lactobacillales bacterium]
MFKITNAFLIVLTGGFFVSLAAKSDLLPPPSNGGYEVTYESGTSGDNDFIYYDVETNNTLTPVYYKISYTPNVVTNNRYGNDAAGPLTEDFVGNASVGNGTEVKDYNVSYGSSINNYNSSLITSIKGDFIKNTVTATGVNRAIAGAIYNYSDTAGAGVIGNIEGSFIGNSVYSADYITSAGAMMNFVYGPGVTGSIGDIKGSFVGNNAQSPLSIAIGGALYSYAWNATTNTAHSYSIIGDITGDFIGNYVIGGGGTGEAGYATGGAIYQHARGRNAHTQIGNITGNFIGNYAISAKSYSFGGAIDTLTISGSTGSSNQIGNITGDFIGNYISAGQGAHGGALHVASHTGGASTVTVGAINGSFIGNHAQTSSSTILALGGAIVTHDNMTFLADGRNNLFSGNYTQDKNGKTYNAIDLMRSAQRTLTFNMVNGGSFTFNDQIRTGSNVTNTTTGLSYATAHNIAINGELDADGVPTTTMTFNNSLINIGRMDVTDAILKFGSYKHPDAALSNGLFVTPSGGTKTTLTLNNSILWLDYDSFQNLNLQTLVTSGNSSIIFGADFENHVSDSITTVSANTAQSIDLRGINITGNLDIGDYVDLFTNRTNGYLDIGNINTFKLVYDGYWYSLTYDTGRLTVDTKLGVAYPIYVPGSGSFDTLDFESTTLDNKSTEGILINDGTATINNSTFSNNSNTGNTYNANGDGGVILNGAADEGDLLVTESTFTSNSADGNGGAIANSDGSAAQIGDTLFDGNMAAGNGGAIYNAGELSVNSGSITDNTATLNGGGIYNDITGELVINGTTFDGNTAALGGALYNAGAATLSDVTFTDNTAAIYNTADGVLKIYDATFENTALSQGITNLGTATVVDTAFINNTIYNAGVLTFVADQNDIALDSTNGIYLDTGSITNLLANSGILTVNAGGLDDAGTSIVNINAPASVTGITDYNPAGIVFL